VSRTVAVTGGAGTLGPHVLRLLEEAGDTVSAPTIDELDLLDEVATARWAGSFDRVDAVVHLVGGWRGGQPADETPLADLVWLHESLVVTLVNTTRAFLPALRSSGGRLVVISSPQAEHPTADNAGYATAKAAAEAWTLAMAADLAEHGGAANILRVKVLSDKNVEAVARGVLYLLEAPMNGQRLSLHR